MCEPDDDLEPPRQPPPRLDPIVQMLIDDYLEKDPTDSQPPQQPTT
jgi:hypothetical protein